MDESEDMSAQQQQQQQQEQDALNAALEIAAAAAAAAQQGEEEGMVRGDMGQTDQTEYMNEEQQTIQPELDVETLTNFEQNGADAEIPEDSTAYREGESYESNNQSNVQIGVEEEQKDEQINIGDEMGDYSHASNSLADISQSHIHENIPANQFEQQPDAADQSGFNELLYNSQSALHHPSQSNNNNNNNRALTHHSKRRKINTCLPCKRRKVKCDREKPYCGQCKKSQIPEHECTWSAAIDHPTTNTTTNGVPITASFPPSSSSTLDNSSNGQWIPPSLDSANWSGLLAQNPQAAESVQLLLERIASLEGLLTAQGRRGTNGEGSQWTEKETTSIAGDARGIAADALAMIAQQTLNNGQGKLRYKRLFSNSNLQWPSSSSRSSRVKESIRLLPEIKAIYGAIQFLESIQEDGIFLGVFPTLVENQLSTLITQIETPAGQGPFIDLSLVALLHYILVLSVDLMPVEQIISLEFVENEDMIADLVDVWIQTADGILNEAGFESKPNLNILSTLLLKRQLQASRGKVNAASITLGNCIRLSRAMGLDKISTQREDIANWDSSSRGQVDVIPTVIHLDQFMEPILLEGSQSLDQQLIAKTPWLSLRCATVRECARQIYAQLAIQEWIADSLPSSSILPSEQISLPLPFPPESLSDGYALNVDLDGSKPSSLNLLQYIFGLSQTVASWKREGRNNLTSCVEVEGAVSSVPRPTFLQIDVPISPEELDPVRTQHMRLIAELIFQYCLFVIRRTDGTMTEQSIDAAERIMQTRSLLGSDFLAPLHKFFPIQRYTLEAAVLVVIYLHQYTAHISEERRQSLQALIDDTYAQPGFEHAHSLLSLSFDVIQAPTEEPSSMNGTKRSAPDDDEEAEDGGEGVNSSTSGLPSAADSNPMILSGMVLSNGNRLSSSHPIVVGLRSFVNGQSLPIGSNLEILDFWDAMQRYCHLFLVG